MAMTEAGFFQQKRSSPAGFALVVMLHVGVLGAVMLAKGPIFVVPDRGPIDVYNVPIPPEPDPNPPEPQPDNPPPQHDTVIDTIPPVVQTRPTDTAVDIRPVDPQPPFGGTGTDTGTRPADPPAPPPVRRAAEIDQRFAAAFQPPYPPAELRAERSGVVRLRVTIGADGRVIRVERLSATSDAFWAVAERQALSRWRFRPATLDGRPVESTKDMTLRFRIEDA
jgi:protein TonB